ncbi:protein FAM166B isoform X2 [Octopus bimaculoides]|uniref:protein FAM166B isoform X2 n=1 Tax=Octopus bimaculoides TaxID=37653 RepID=UPI0022E37030|nr:protein FAM166B isoform X2 [Octopus bimaculoides]
MTDNSSSYKGYIPQLKYRFGDTYGKTTHKIAKEIEESQWNSCTERSRMDLTPFQASNPGEMAQLKEDTQDVVKSQLITGYTGYIPKLSFIYGDTYPKGSGISMNIFKTEQKEYRLKQSLLEKQTSLQSPLTPITSEELIENKLREFIGNRSKKTFATSRRSLTEAHIPGYTGYIPKIKATDTGLGCRYHSSNSIALKQFWSSRLPKEQNLEISNKSDTRIYRIEGMIPHYTGYLPQSRYQYGNTYGDTCRSLEVCSRQKICFDHHEQQIRPFSVIF